MSRSYIKKWIDAGQVSVNQKHPKAGQILKTKDQISVTVPPLLPSLPQAADIPLNILYEDSDILVLNKPCGLSVHPGAGQPENTLVNALLHHCKDLSGIGGVLRPGIVHRLDKDTSGVMVVAKNDHAHRHLSQQFKDRQVHKTYVAMVKGTPRSDQGIIDRPIGRHPRDRKKMTVAPSGKKRGAVTRYEVKKSFGSASLLYCYPETGRTHQIRVHLWSLGHPILGDKAYNPKSSAARMLLHALRLEFKHPSCDKKMCFEAPLPPEFNTTPEPADD